MPGHCRQRRTLSTPLPALAPAQPVAPWAQCPPGRLAALVGLFTDIDDTLTREGAIEPEALEALHHLQTAGLPVIAITGRPMGWSRSFARDWPVQAIVAENGAVAWQRDPAYPDGVRPLFLQSPTEREHNGARLRNVAQRILAEVPGACLAQDSLGRVTDIAIDHSEFTHLPPVDIQRVVDIMTRAGMVATVSSIHINGWFGEHNKWTGAQWILRELRGRDLQAEREAWLYVGDSTNDQLMFEHLDLTVGVANLLRFADQLQCWPQYLTAAERGRGFAEVARAVAAARAGSLGPTAQDP
jgi:HAD superfamily hydrolase (TIGR01484 family)